MQGRQASPACLSLSPLSQDIPACEEHADVQIPQVMREFITRGAWAIQEWQPDHSLKLERSLRLAREARVADSETHAEEDRHGPACHRLLGTTRQTMNEVAMCPVYLCCPREIMRGASLTLRRGTAWTPWRMVTQLTCLPWVVSLVLPPYFPPSQGNTLSGGPMTQFVSKVLCCIK